MGRGVVAAGQQKKRKVSERDVPVSVKRQVIQSRRGDDAG